MKLCKNGHQIGSNNDCFACQCSKRAKERWKKPSKAMIEACNNNRNTNIKGLESKEAQAKRNKYFASDLHKQRARKQALKLAEERRSGLRSPCTTKQMNTKPELAVKRVLDNLGIEYIQQYEVGPYKFDFGIPEYNYLIEVQGEYWHSLDNNIANDLAKESYIKTQHNNYRIIYISELQTLQINAIYEIIKKSLGISEIKTRNLQLSLIDVRDAEKTTAESFLKAYHYLPRFRKSMRYIHGIFHNGEIIGVIIYATPSYNSSAKRHKLRPKHVLELSRLVVADDCHVHNLISKSLSKSIKLLKATSSACLLTTFSDPYFGHDGHIYKASNWIQDGKTAPSYYYITQDNEIIHKKVVWDHASKFGMSESDYARDYNFKRIDTPPKHRFIYWLRKPPIQDEKSDKLVEAKCECGVINYITTSSLNKSIRKNNRYICLSCSIKSNWENGFYNNKPRRTETNRNERIEVNCACGRSTIITRKSYLASVKKHGKYTCMSCVKKQQHENGVYIKFLR